MVLIDPEYLKDRKVYANILAAFRYGREDLDVLGLTFRKDLFVSTIQVSQSCGHYSACFERHSIWQIMGSLSNFVKCLVYF